MAASLREQFAARAAAALLGHTVAGEHVYRSRKAALSAAVDQAIVVTPAGEDVQPFGDYSDRCEFALDVEIIARGEPWDQVADPVAVEAHALLMRDEQLQGDSSEIRGGGSQYDDDEADPTAGVLITRYRITYLRASNDLTRKPLF